MKKLLSLVLALAMVLTAVSAFAASGNAAASVDENGNPSVQWDTGSNPSKTVGDTTIITIVVQHNNNTEGKEVYTATYDGSKMYTYTAGKEVYTATYDGTQGKEVYSYTSTSNSKAYTSTSDAKSYTSTSDVKAYTSTSDVKSFTSTTDIKDTKDLKDLKDYSSNIEKTYDNSSTYEKVAGDTIYTNSFNDNSDHSDNSDSSTNDSYNTSTTETTTNTESGNSSASASASASAAAGDAGSSSKKSSGSGASGSGSSSSSAGTSKGASSSASSSAKAVAVSKSSGGSGSGSGSSTVVAPSIQLVVVPDTAETTALKNSFAEAIKAGDPKTALPENISSKLSADLKSVNEFVTAKLVGDITGIASATVNIQFPTKYAAGDKVVVLFGIPNGNTTQWINVNGIIESDGSISMILTSTVLQALSGKTFALAVLSK